MTLHDHLAELRGRLFWVATAFLAASALAYPNFNSIMSLLVQPLGNHKLYYMTPAGGLSFIIKVCIYVGIVVVLPVAIYHLCRFAAPVMGRTRLRTVFFYTATSTMLALAGMAFAYLVSLPAALDFLTGITLEQVSDLLSIDSYLSFVMAYLVAGALLFQLPLLMLIVNRITPLTPGKLLGFQRYIVVGSFVVAAILSPTPDVVNQTIMAVPMIFMYQVGIAAVWTAQRRTRRSTVAQSSQPVTRLDEAVAARPLQSPSHSLVEPPVLSPPKSATPAARVAPSGRSIDGFTRGQSDRPTRQVVIPARSQPVPQSRAMHQTRSLDGFRCSPV